MAKNWSKEAVSKSANAPRLTFVTEDGSIKNRVVKNVTGTNLISEIDSFTTECGITDEFSVTDGNGGCVEMEHIENNKPIAFPVKIEVIIKSA